MAEALHCRRMNAGIYMFRERRIVIQVEDRDLKVTDEITLNAASTSSLVGVRGRRLASILEKGIKHGVV